MFERIQRPERIRSAGQVTKQARREAERKREAQRNGARRNKHAPV